MKRINNDDVYTAMMYASQEKKALAAEAASAMSRMEARCRSALRFVGGVQRIRQRREWAQEIK